MRRRDYRQKTQNYKCMRSYYSIEDMVECGPMVFGNQEKYFVEVNKSKHQQRGMRGSDRHLCVMNHWN